MIVQARQHGCKVLNCLLYCCRVAGMHNAGTELERYTGVTKWDMDTARSFLLQVKPSSAVYAFMCPNGAKARVCVASHCCVKQSCGL